jgi:hypothetical protein
VNHRSALIYGSAYGNVAVRACGQYNTQKSVQSTRSTKRGTETSAVLTVILGMCEIKIVKKR